MLQLSLKFDIFHDHQQSYQGYDQDYLDLYRPLFQNILFRTEFSKYFPETNTYTAVFTHYLQVKNLQGMSKDCCGI